MANVSWYPTALVSLPLPQADNHGDPTDLLETDVRLLITEPAMTSPAKATSSWKEPSSPGPGGVHRPSNLTSRIAESEQPSRLSGEQ